MTAPRGDPPSEVRVGAPVAGTAVPASALGTGPGTECGLVRPLSPKKPKEPMSSRAVSVAPSEYPVVAIRGNVVFPGPTLPLAIRGPDATEAVKVAESGNRIVFVVAHRDGDTAEDGQEQLYEVGVLARIEHVHHTKGGSRLLLTGLHRARAHSFHERPTHMAAQTESLVEIQPSDPSAASFSALNQELRIRASELAQRRGVDPGALSSVLSAVSEPGRFTDLAAAYLELPVAEKQALLETLEVEARMEKVLVELQRQLDLQRSRRQIQDKVNEQLQGRQREMYLREQLRAIRAELGEDGDEDDALDAIAEQLEAAQLPKAAQDVAQRELARLRRIGSQSAEYQVALTYLERLVQMPWNARSEERVDLDEAQAILQADHHGLEKVKERLLDFLSVRKLHQDAKRTSQAPILLFSGPPGVGKTSIAQSIAKALGRKYARIALGGVRDEAEIRGHRRTYVGAMPGRIVESLQRAGTKNPVLLLDEVDKLMASHGDPTSALLEVLDPAQNHEFVDHYLGVPFDLSEVLFIATANSLASIPPPLRDRMEIIEFSGYTEGEKLQIARQHLLPRQLEAAGLADPGPAPVVDDEVLRQIIAQYTRESGVRKLNQQLATLTRKLARARVSGNPIEAVTASQVQPLLGRPRIFPERVADRPQVGLATGLYYTPMGGDIMFVEAALRGTGGELDPGQPPSQAWSGTSLTVTGQLGDVMQESARAALTFASMHADRLGIPRRHLGSVQAHIHVPAGAIPKDGPSAGVTMATALISAMSGRPVRREVAMTGEVTLLGRVLPIGGVKEKVLGAHRAGATEVILPAANEADLVDVPAEVRERLEFHLVSDLQQVLRIALTPPDPAEETDWSAALMATAGPDPRWPAAPGAEGHA